MPPVSFSFISTGTMNSEDEAYNNFIVTSDAEQGEKENVAGKQSKTTSEQFKMIFHFTKEIDENAMTKEMYDGHWDALAEKLNKVGPPIRNSWEWRRTWTVHKYNRKRKHSAVSKSDNRRRSNQEPYGVHSDDQSTPPMTLTDQLSVRMVEKLDEILKVLSAQSDNRRRSNQEPYDVRSVDQSTAPMTLSDQLSVRMVEKLDEILHELKKSNDYLKRLAIQTKA